VFCGGHLPRTSLENGVEMEAPAPPKTSKCGASSQRGCPSANRQAGTQPHGLLTGRRRESTYAVRRTIHRRIATAGLADSRPSPTALTQKRDRRQQSTSQTNRAFLRGLRHAAGLERGRIRSCKEWRCLKAMRGLTGVLLSHATDPIGRSSVEIHHGKDSYRFWPDAVKQGVWKSA